MRRLNVLHIITQLELGGAQKNALHIVSLLDKMKYNLSLITSKGGILDPDAMNIPGVEVTFLSSLKRNISPLRDFISLIKLTRFIKSKKVDIVHTHSSKAGILGRWAARFAGVPVIFHTIHGWSFHNYQKPLARRIFILLERITAKITHRLIAVSESDIRKGLDSSIGTRDKYILVKYGIPLEEFTNCHVDAKEKKRELGLRTDFSIVGMVACFKPQKAVEDFLKAAALVKESFPEVQFLLVGDGVLRKKLESLRQRLALDKDIIFLGWRRDIPEILSILDIFVLTSLWEGLPIVLLEAMACRLPIVATSIGGSQEIIKDGINGFLVPCGDIKTIAQRIVDLLKNRTQAHKMEGEGRDFLNSSFEVKYMIREIDKLYQGLSERSVVR